MSKQYTSEQQAILDTKAKKVIISASAGSGKTFILIEKLIDLIVNKKIPIERILVLTFTKVAAKEIKSRLTNAILASQPTPELLNNIDNLPISDISTIDSFCEKIIKRNISSLSLDEDFVVLDEKSSQALKKLAFTSSYQHFAREEKGQFEEIFLAFKRNKQAISECMFSIDDFLSCQKENDFLDNFVKNYTNFVQKAENYLLKYIKEKTENINRALSNINFSLNAKEEELLSMFKAFTLLPEGDIFEISKIFNCMTVPPLRGKLGDEGKRLFNYLKNQIKDILKITQPYNYLPANAREKNMQGSLAKAIINLYKLYSKNYQNLKTKRGGLDFADIERQTYNLLQNEEIKKGLASRYDYIFIDEYQDTSRVQEAILKPIAEGGYFVAVGDIKQGIYAFRNASMDIMLNDIENFSSSDEGEALYLNGNFRTDKAILEFVNKIFSMIMTKESVGIDYKKDARLLSKVDFLDDSHKKVKVIISKMPKQEKQPCQDVYSVRDDRLSSNESLTYEAQIILDEISKVLASEIYDAKQKKFRKTQPSDIALLFRNRSPLMAEVVRQLNLHSFAVNADLKQQLIDKYEIALICSLLKLTLNLDDDYSIASVLCSPFGKMSLYDFALFKQNCGQTALKDAICSSQDFVGFLKMVDEFKFDIQVYGVSRALFNIFGKYDFYSYLDDEGKKSINSLLKLIKEAGLDFNPAAIISLLEEGVKVSGNGGGNAISVLTIHATKGLEYPIVMLCDAGSSLKKIYNKNFFCSQEFGLGLYLCDFDTMTKVPSPIFLAGRIHRQKREWLDEVMIFYVALTRAQNRLIIIGKGEDKDFSFASLEEQNSYLKFILFAFGENFAAQLFEQGEINLGEWEFCIPLQIEQEKKETVFENKQNLFEEEVNQYNSFIYPGEAECRLALKNSVSSLNKSEDQVIINGGEKRESAIERGNAYHQALKLLDFNKINNISDLEKELKLIDKKMDEGYVNLLDINLLYKNISILKSVIKNEQAFKEKEFIMRLPASENSENNLIIQGIIDLFIAGEKVILIDYKYTSSLNHKNLLERYSTQLQLYKSALEEGLKRKVDEIYLLSLKEGSLITYEK